MINFSMINFTRINFAEINLARINFARINLARINFAISQVNFAPCEIELSKNKIGTCKIYLAKLSFTLKFLSLNSQLCTYIFLSYMKYQHYGFCGVKNCINFALYMHQKSAYWVLNIWFFSINQNLLRPYHARDLHGLNEKSSAEHLLTLVNALLTLAFSYTNNL